MTYVGVIRHGLEHQKQKSIENNYFISISDFDVHICSVIQFQLMALRRNKSSLWRITPRYIVSMSTWNIPIFRFYQFLSWSDRGLLTPTLAYSSLQRGRKLSQNQKLSCSITTQIWAITLVKTGWAYIVSPLKFFSLSKCKSRDKFTVERNTYTPVTTLSMSWHFTADK